MKVMHVLSLFLALSLTVSCANSDTEGEWMEGTPKHHLKTGYRNFPVTEIRDPGFAFYVRRIYDSLVLPDVPEDHAIPEQEAISSLKFHKNTDTITWLGHSTFLIKLENNTILTDPYLTEYASPFIRGPRRYVNAGISIDNLPEIDILIVSHDHFDHLDTDTIKALPGKDNIQVLVPLGVGRLFEEYGYKDIQEMDWWSETEIAGTTFTLLPAMHDSGRSSSMKNNTLWGAWSIRGMKKNLYFAGDTGYSASLFKEIGKTISGFDYAFVPIGAYAPRDSLKMSHTNPEEAVQIGKDINAANLIGMHWGTIKLSDEPIWEPPLRFKKAGKSEGFSEENIWVMKIGETRKMISAK